MNGKWLVRDTFNALNRLMKNGNGRGKLAQIYLVVRNHKGRRGGLDDGLFE